MSHSFASSLTRAAALAAAVAGTALASATAARAQEGFYGSLQTGAAILGNMSNATPQSTTNLRLDLDTGWTLSGAVGYRFAQPFRAELTVDYLDGSLDGSYSENGIFVPCGTFPNQPCLGPRVDGDVKAWSGFAMGYYDVDLGSRLTPYLGAGLGLVRTSLDVETTARLNNGTSREFDVIDDNDTELGYRLAAGLAYDLDPVVIDVGYTFTTTARPNYAGRGSGIPAFNYAERLESHAVKAGVRLKF
jgi:opacity protein-like surface antigen